MRTKAAPSCHGGVECCGHLRFPGQCRCHPGPHRRGGSSAAAYFRRKRGGESDLAEARTYALRKRLIGPVFITNYAPSTLSREERIRLIQEREEWPPNDISFDIRSDHFGGGFRLRGKFRLRSFAAILDFWGGSLGEEPDLDVPKDPRTPPVAENPVRTTNIMIANDVPEGADLFVAYRDRYYAVVTEGSHARWNRQAFRLLYHLFQMTVTEVPRVGVPSITIAK